MLELKAFGLLHLFSELRHHPDEKWPVLRFESFINILSDVQFSSVTSLVDVLVDRLLALKHSRLIVSVPDEFVAQIAPETHTIPVVRQKSSDVLPTRHSRRALIPGHTLSRRVECGDSSTERP